MPSLFMVELAVADVAASRRWYVATLGLAVSHADPATGFVLLADGRGGRLALKPGPPAPGGVTLHFEVAALPAGPAVSSPEGYREVFVRDPDGYRVGLFAWDRPPG